MPQNTLSKVQIDSLSLVQFRNIARAEFAPSPRFNVISGRNGMGKTNLIESIYLLGALRSFRTSVRREIISQGERDAKISARFGQSLHGLSVEIQLGAQGRQISMDGKAVVPDGDYFRTLPIVLFLPGNMELVQGSHVTRRRFLVRALFQADAAYPQLYRQYARALANRNTVIRRQPLDMRALVPFDSALAKLGSQIVASRAAFTAQLSQFFEEGVLEVSGGNRGAIRYRPRVSGDEAAFLQVLDAKRQLDVDRGYTTCGPHADDLDFEVDGRSAKKYASQGQQRTVVLAAKIAETRVLSQRCHRMPLLLLDDVSSELDRDRNRHLFLFLSGVGGQVFITTTHPDHISTSGERADFCVTNGALSSL